MSAREAYDLGVLSVELTRVLRDGFAARDGDGDHAFAIGCATEDVAEAIVALAQVGVRVEGHLDSETLTFECTSAREAS